MLLVGALDLAAYSLSRADHGEARVAALVALRRAARHRRMDLRVAEPNHDATAASSITPRAPTR